MKYYLNKTLLSPVFTRFSHKKIKKLSVKNKRNVLRVNKLKKHEHKEIITYLKRYCPNGFKLMNML